MTSKTETIEGTVAEFVTAMIGGVSMSCTRVSSQSIMPAWGSRVVNG